MSTSMDPNAQFTGMGVSTPGSGAVPITYMSTFAQGLTPDPRTGQVDFDGTITMTNISAQKLTLTGAGTTPNYGLQVGYASSYTDPASGSYTYGVAAGATGINSILMGPVQIGTNGFLTKGVAPGSATIPYWPALAAYRPTTNINGYVDFGARPEENSGAATVAPTGFTTMNPLVTNYGYYVDSNFIAKRWEGKGNAGAPVGGQFSIVMTETLSTPTNTFALIGPQGLSTPYINGNCIRFVATPTLAVVGAASPTALLIAIVINPQYLDTASDPTGSFYIPTENGTSFMSRTNCFPSLEVLTWNMTPAAGGPSPAPPMVTSITTLNTGGNAIQFSVNMGVGFNNTWPAGVPFEFKFNFGWHH